MAFIDMFSAVQEARNTMNRADGMVANGVTGKWKK